MAAVLGMFLKGTWYDVVVESAGAGPSARKGGTASIYAAVACRLVGLDIIGHQRRHISQVNLSDYDLIVAADDFVVTLLLEQGADIEKIYNAGVSNGQWPFKLQEDYNKVFQQVLSAMFMVVSRYFMK
jgi:protein-tyrosine-phosphatase